MGQPVTCGIWQIYSWSTLFRFRVRFPVNLVAIAGCCKLFASHVQVRMARSLLGLR
jgi:hypothetical protein